MKQFIIINGPNLNLLGVRQPDVYGVIGFDCYMKTLKDKYPDFKIDYYQSNIEGELINKIQEIGFSYDGIILNAGAYTHTSIAIADAISSIETKVVEVHISNVFTREEYRHVSFLSPVCKGIITGFGLKSYELGLLSFI